MKTRTYTNTDNKVINLDETANSCDSCKFMFPLCMIENTDLCCKRINEVMERVFRG